MTEIIDDNTLDDFERLTSYPINTFLSDYLDFIDNQYPNIINFYSGITNTVPTESFNILVNLIEEQRKIIDVIILNAPSLNTYNFWSLLEYVEDIGHALETAKNASRWLRSNVTADGYKQQITIDYMLSQGETLEKTERDVLKSNNASDSWIQTAIENELREEDYTLDGGALIQVNYKNNSSIFINSVVDNIDSQQKIYGKDIKASIEWENDDLVVLGYKDTLQQSAEILTNLQRGQDPAFPDRGVNTKSILGNSFAAISYPIIFQDLASNFATDDSFKSFKVLDIKRQQDAIFLDFSVETRANEVFNGSLPLQ